MYKFTKHPYLKQLCSTDLNKFAHGHHITVIQMNSEVLGNVTKLQ